MKIVEEPDMPPMDDPQKIAYATECAFGTLFQQARAVGLELAPVLGDALMNLPDQKVTQQFKDACRAVLVLHTR